MKSLSEGICIITKMNFLCTKLRKMSTEAKKASDYFRSGGRYIDSCCNVLLSLKCILNPIEIIISIVVVISIVVATSAPLDF